MRSSSNEIDATDRRPRRRLSLLYLLPVSVAGARGRLSRRPPRQGSPSLGGVFRQNGPCYKGENSAICTLLAVK